MYMIETKNLTKIYGNFTAVQRLNLHVRKGTIYGFLGPNGAGKSTTMKMFLGLARPTAGSFTIAGMEYPKDRMEILRRTSVLRESERKGKPGHHPQNPGSSKRFCGGCPFSYRTFPCSRPPCQEIFFRHEAAPGSCRRSDRETKAFDPG